MREPESQLLDMTLPDFVQCSQQWRARRLYLRHTLMRHQHQPAGSGAGEGQPADGQPALEAGSAAAAALAADLQGGLDWGWLGGLRRSQRYGPVLRADLEAGGQGGLLPAAYETCDRLLTQVAGRRRVLLLPPGQAFGGLYPYPTHHPYDRYSMVDLEAPDAGLWPKFGGGARGTVAVLGPGDVLYVPAYW